MRQARVLDFPKYTSKVEVFERARLQAGIAYGAAVTAPTRSLAASATP